MHVVFDFEWSYCVQKVVAVMSETLNIYGTEGLFWIRVLISSCDVVVCR